jgi:hypothetical protein
VKAIRILTSLFVVLVACSAALGGIRPSFLSEVCSWRATDIVVVTEGKEIDGVFTVLESLKGDLKPGQTIEIPEMAEFKSKDARLINGPWYEQQRGKPKEYVTGDRMILFLRDSAKSQLWSDEEQDEKESRPKTNAARWQTANLMGDEIKHSTVWIEKTQVYCFIQVINPGPSLLTKLDLTEEKLKQGVAEVISVQDGLKLAIEIQDPTRKSLSLEPFLHNSIYLARERAFAELVNCDEAALPVLKGVLNDESLIGIHTDAIDALEAIGGRTIGPEFTSIVERETEFWKQKAPTLKLGWQNEFDSKGDSALLANHRAVLEQALLSLKDIRYAGSQSAVAAVRKLMLSTPQIYFEDASNTSAEILRTLQGTGEVPAIPHYELHITGNKAFSTDSLRARFAEALTEYQHLRRAYTPDMFIYALDRISDFISSQGFTSNGSGPPPSESPDDSKDVVYSEMRASDHEQSAVGTNKRGVVVFLHINEGKRYRLGTVKIEGAHLFSPEQVRGMLSLESGGVCDFVAIARWRSSLEQAYKNRGYLQVSVEDESDEHPASFGKDSGTVDFKIKITEGQPFKVQSINFEGKTEIPSLRLSGALKLAEGELYSEEKLDASIEALNDLGLDIEKENDVQAEEDEGRGVVKIVIILDKRTSRLSSGSNRLQRRVRRIFN